MLGVASLGSWWKLPKGDFRLRHDSTDDTPVLLTNRFRALKLNIKHLLHKGILPGHHLPTLQLTSCCVMSVSYPKVSSHTSQRAHSSFPYQQQPHIRLLRLLERQCVRRLSRLKASGGETIEPLDALKLACRLEGIQLVQDQKDDEETWEDLLEDEEIVWDPTLELAEGTPTPEADNRSMLQLSEAAHVSMEELERLKRRGVRICALDVSPQNSSGGFGRLADVLDGMTVQHIPLEDLHADAAAQLGEFDHIVVLPILRDDRRAWQAWVRLSKVFRLEQVAVLSS